MTSLTIALPDALTVQAQPLGLLNADVIADLVAAEIRRRTIGALFQTISKTSSSDAEIALSDEAVAALVKTEISAYRQEKRAH